MTRVRVRAGDGRRVHLEDGRVLTSNTTPPKIVEIDLTFYVRRRLACGDLVKVEADAAQAEAAAGAETAKPASDAPADAPPAPAAPNTAAPKPATPPPEPAAPDPTPAAKSK